MESNICFVRENIHRIAETKCSASSVHLVRLTNYDHVTKDLFSKLKIVQETPNLSRFVNPTPKICLACCSYLKEVQLEDTTKKRQYSSSLPEPSTSNRTASFNKLINDIKTLDLTEDELNILMQAVGECIAPLASKHVANLNKKHLGQRLEEMVSMSYQSTWQTTFSPLKYILLGLINGAGKRTETQETRNCRIRFGIHAIETMFAMMNLNYTSPIILSEMLYMYFLSNSRRVCEIYGAVRGGSSSTLQNALQKLSKSPQKFPEDGYVVVAFDNNQVMAKSHRVELDCKLKISVVTSIAAFELLNVENPQKPMKFPLLFQISPNNASALNEKLNQFTASSLKLVNEYLVKYIKRRLVYIEASISEDGSDYVDTPSNFTPNVNRTDGMPYEDIAQSTSPCTVYDQECLLMNPNGFNTVREVLEHIQKIALSKDRQWITVVVDGIPFSLAQDIVRSSVFCQICKEVVREKEISSHYFESHNQPSPPQLERAFTNILLRPGAGHYEMNMVKALFSGWFPLYLEPVTEILGFNTPKAKWCVENCTDHHKAWQILEITFESLSDELLCSYVKVCRDSTLPQKPTIEGFIQKVNESENENVKAAFQFVYYWCFSILLFRGAIRRNNFDVAVKAREQDSGIFYAFRHPKYQLINCLDVAELVQMPVDVRKTIYTESMVIPGSNVGQGIDFLLEQRNRRMKSYVIRNGIPTGDQWTTASASMQSLDKIIGKVEDRLHLQISSTHHKIDHSVEKKAARSMFRRHGVFDLRKKSTIALLPDTSNGMKPFNSILRCQLVAESNRKSFYEGIIKTGQASVSCYVSLCRSDAEDEVVNTWGVTKLRAATKTMLKYLPKALQREVNLEMKELKSADKEKLKEIYWRVFNLFDQEEQKLTEVEN